MVTHGERRGAALRQQADARWAVQAESGDALSLAAYTGSPGDLLTVQQPTVQHTCKYSCRNRSKCEGMCLCSSHSANQYLHSS